MTIIRIINWFILSILSLLVVKPIYPYSRAGGGGGGSVQCVQAFSMLDYSHYLDYLPYRQGGMVGFEDFRTAQSPPVHLRERKMYTGGLAIEVEEVLANPTWPAAWPYGFEDFRPLDYTRDDVINTGPRYQYTQSLIMADHATIIPGILRLPIRRHFVMPKDKFSLAEHLQQYSFPGAKVLELFSCYESILPPGKLGPVVGVGWYGEEMKSNAALDDFIEQDLTVDPYLPLADGYFDIVVMPAMFQLLQRPKEMFQEINRVLKPGGMAFIGVKLAMWGVLGWKQGRYYVETNYLEDVLAAGSFFHYANGFDKPQAYDLTLPEMNIVGKVKDTFFPSPRLDFYGLVQAKKVSDSLPPQPKDLSPPIIEGSKYQTKKVINPVTKDETLGPFY